MYHLGLYCQENIISEMMEQKLKNKYDIKVHKYLLEEEMKNELRYYGYQFDMLLFDVYKSEDGLELAKRILQKNNFIKLIFVLDDIERISDYFEVEPVYVLNSHFKEKQFFSAIEKAMQKIHVMEEKILQVGYKGHLMRIPYDEIYYVESDKRYSILHMKNEKQKILMKLSAVLELLPQYFIRCHQSFIINLNKIRSYERSEVILENGEKITISRSREEDVRLKINTYFKKLQE